MAGVAAFGTGGANQACLERSVATWEAYDGQEGNHNRFKDAWDGRQISWATYPEPTVATDDASMTAILEGWRQVSDWKCVTQDHATTATHAYFKCNWEGSVSKINGFVMGAGAHTMHVVDCENNTEETFADFGGVLTAMGAA